MRLQIYIHLILIVLLASCNKDYDAQAPAGSGKMTFVPISVTVADYRCDSATKSLKPYIPEVENLIYDVWVVQYSNRGVLLPSTIGHYRANQDGTLVWAGETFSESVANGIALMESEDPCTVCFVANVDDNVPEWPDNIYAFREVMIPVLDTDESVNLTKLPLCGYYYGPVTYGQTINVSLGRMMTRINIVLNNQTGYDLSDVSVSITNAPRYAHIYPNIEITMLGENERNATRQMTDTDLYIPSGGSKKLYYYMAPNLYGASWPTTLWTRCTMGDKPMVGTIVLGDGAPADSDTGEYSTSVDTERDFRLYPNNQYTFTLNYVDNVQ